MQSQYFGVKLNMKPGRIKLTILEKQSSVWHACEAETSVALALYPEKVKMESVREHDIPFAEFRKYLFS